MIANFLIHETVLVFLIELLVHSHSLTYFQVLLVSARSDGEVGDSSSLGFDYNFMLDHVELISSCLREMLGFES